MPRRAVLDAVLFDWGDTLMQFAYDPHLPPVLRFDSTGASDKLKGGRGMPCPYITNYDSKYRMGRDTGEDEAG